MVGHGFGSLVQCLDTSMLIIRPCLRICQYVRASDRMGGMKKKPFRIADVAHLGGMARRDKLTLAQRAEISKNASLARWKKIPKAERQELARRAVLARWKAVRSRKKAKP